MSEERRAVSRKMLARLWASHRRTKILVFLVLLAISCVFLRREAHDVYWEHRSPVHPAYARLSPTALLVESQRKAVMGRRRSLIDVRRTVTDIGPLVRESVRQPAIEANLAALAATQRTTTEALRAELQDLQEADLLLESGGDPNAVSRAGAVGAAQWLAGSARQAGLHVDTEKYARIVCKARRLRAAMAAARRCPPQWRKSPAPGQAPLPRDQWLAWQQQQLRLLEQQRLAADERYDPRKAIQAQTRVLLRAWRRFGAPDWALQAYHGGARGVTRTLEYYRADDPTLPAQFSVPFADLYFALTPRSHPRAFSYIYGRADDHRYYWWRVQMARQALALYRRSPKEFYAFWQALVPGYPIDRAWYPEALRHPFADTQALQDAIRDRALFPLPADSRRYGFTAGNQAPLDAAHARCYAAVSRETLGMLIRLAAIYRGQGGKEVLRITGASTTTAYLQLEAKSAANGKKVNGDGAVALTLHAAGLCADVAYPTNAWDRKVLEYALSRMGDRMRIGWLRDQTAGAYHLCPNPAFAQEFRMALQ